MTGRLCLGVLGGKYGATPQIGGQIGISIDFPDVRGSPVAAAVGQAVLDVIQREGLMENALGVGERLKRDFKELSSRHPAIADVRGAGLYIGIELVEGGSRRSGEPAPAPALAKAVLNGLRERRVLIGAAGRYGSVLKIRPPLCFSSANADQLVAALDDTLAQI
jgi:4-aminobutyrate aminotransferase-like enzyme